MSDPDPAEELSRDSGCLAEYRRTVEQLRGETVAELGAQPMAPEKVSMIAIAVVSLPLVALLLPMIPVKPEVWQVCLALVVAWLAAFHIQSARYQRFHAHWQRKVVAYNADLIAPVVSGRLFLRDA
jgi:hypothetical protein